MDPPDLEGESSKPTRTATATESRNHYSHLHHHHPTTTTCLAKERLASPEESLVTQARRSPALRRLVSSSLSVVSIVSSSAETTRSVLVLVHPVSHSH